MVICSREGLRYSLNVLDGLRKVSGGLWKVLSGHWKVSDGLGKVLDGNGMALFSLKCFLKKPNHSEYTQVLGLGGYFI